MFYFEITLICCTNNFSMTEKRAQLIEVHRKETLQNLEHDQKILFAHAKFRKLECTFYTHDC